MRSRWLKTNRRLRKRVGDLETALRNDPDKMRLAELLKHEKSLWKANAKMRRVYADFDTVRDCMCYMVQHGLILPDEGLEQWVPKEFGGAKEYVDSDIKVWKPWWRKADDRPLNTTEADRILSRFG